MPFEDVTPMCMVVCRLMVDKILIIIQLLGTMFDDRAFHSDSLAVVGKKKLFPNVPDACLI